MRATTGGATTGASTTVTATATAETRGAGTSGMGTSGTDGAGTIATSARRDETTWSESARGRGKCLRRAPVRPPLASYTRLLSAGPAPAGAPAPVSRARVDLDPDGLEPGEAMDAEGADAGGDDDAAMMAMMGMSGFGSTKVCVPVSPAWAWLADGAYAE
jgi:hypothetical protein